LDHYLLASILALSIGVLSFTLKLLSPSGSLATIALAFLIFALGGWQWTVPIFAFFFLSSFLSKVGKQRKKAFAETFQKTDTRDAFQVLANGGMAAILILLDAVIPNPIWYPVYLSAIAAATADTWATEIGVLSHRQPLHILSWKRIGHGSSGAISFVGSLAGLAGAITITFIGAFFIQLTIVEICIIIICGTAGNLIDSILGASVQACFRCNVCGMLSEKTEHCSVPALHESGLRFVRNDAVNFLSALCASLLAILLFKAL
jgi:uncharacterized protein (TIGR00297 family)